ncbi:MAG: type II toxin-antitoxin system RelE/ParE family toxin [Ktedonobacteraceae bacterium]
MGMKRWGVVLTQNVKKQLAVIKDRRIQESLRIRLRRLEYEPDKQGKPLKDDLIGHRSVRAVGQRYRILYRLEEQRVTVVVVTIGIRKEGDKQDAYELANRLARLGLLDIEENPPQSEQ